MNNNLDLEYLSRAYEQALKFSSDPSSQNGAILVNKGVITGVGANCFPKGVNNTEERWQRPLKYSYVEHAERNAIYNAAKKGNSTEGSTLYCPWFACADCARAIIQAGIIRCVGHDVKATNERWDESIKTAFEMFDEAGVKYEFLNHKFGYKIKRNNEIIEV